MAPRLAPLMRAVQVFGFHLATLDLRQSSDQHEAVVAELLAVAGIEADYAALDEPARQRVLLALLREPRPLRVTETARPAAYSELVRDELAVFEAAFGDATGRIFLIAAPCAAVALIAVLFIREVPLRTTIEREDETVSVD